MPKKRHEESRMVFVNQAKKMCQKEFIKWFSLTKLINPYLSRLQMKTNSIPTLFLMGEEDYLFMPPVEELVRRNEEFKLIKIKDSGHVCNIDQPDMFNELSIDFISMIQNKKAIAI
jgi:pimeloyl-ACP methyl ester carboxylesterase